MWVCCRAQGPACTAHCQVTYLFLGRPSHLAKMTSFPSSYSCWVFGHEFGIRPEPVCVITSPCPTEAANSSTPKAWPDRKFGTGAMSTHKKEPADLLSPCIAHCAPLSGSRIQQTVHNYATTIVYTCLLYYRQLSYTPNLKDVFFLDNERQRWYVYTHKLGCKPRNSIGNIIFL